MHLHAETPERVREMGGQDRGGDRGSGRGRGRDIGRGGGITIRTTEYMVKPSSTPHNYHPNNNKPSITITRLSIHSLTRTWDWISQTSRLNHRHPPLCLSLSLHAYTDKSHACTYRYMHTFTSSHIALSIYVSLPRLTYFSSLSGSTSARRSASLRPSSDAASARSGSTPTRLAKSPTQTPARPSASSSAMASSSASPSPCTRDPVPAS